MTLGIKQERHEQLDNNIKDFHSIQDCVTFLINESNQLEQDTISQNLQMQLFEIYLYFQEKKCEAVTFNNLRNALNLNKKHLIVIDKNRFADKNKFGLQSQVQENIHTTLKLNSQETLRRISAVIEKGIEKSKEFIALVIKLCSSEVLLKIGNKFQHYIGEFSEFIYSAKINFEDLKNNGGLIESLSSILCATSDCRSKLSKEVRIGLMAAIVGAMLLFAGGGGTTEISTDDGRGSTVDSTQTVQQDTLSLDEGRSTVGTTIPGDEIVDTKDLNNVGGATNTQSKKEAKEVTSDHQSKKTAKNKSKKQEQVTFATKKTSFEKIKNFLSILKFRGRTDRENGTPACAKSARLTLQKFKIEVPQKGSAVDVHKYYANTSNYDIQDEYNDYIGKAVGKDLKPHLGSYLQKLETNGANVVDIFITSPNTYKKYYTKIVKGKRVRKSKRVSYGHRVVGVCGRDTKERYIVDAYNGFKKPVRREDFQEWCYKKNRSIQSIAGFESEVHIGDMELVGTYKKKSNSKIKKPILEEYASKKKAKVEPNFAPGKIGATKGSLLSHKRFEDLKKKQTAIIKNSLDYVAKNLKTKKKFWDENVGETIEEGIKDSQLPKQLAHMFRGIVLQESKGDYDAKNGSYEGLAQMGKEDAEFVGMDPDDRDDPSKSVKGSLELLRLKYNHLRGSKVVNEFMQKYKLDNEHFLYPLVINSYCAGEGTMETIIEGISGKKHRKAIHSYIAQHGKRGAMLYVMDKGHSYSRIYNKEKKNYVPSVTLRTEQILGNQPITTLIGP